MNINFNNKNGKYFILFFIISVFSAIVFLGSYKDIQSVFANPQVMKDQMNNTMETQNQNMMTDQKPMQMQKMMKQMNKTGMMDQKPMQMQKMMKQMNKTGMMTGPTDK
ncbi:MAG TPA: hypothetical protein VJ767_09675 [Nitrososphaeraceae archaeon]|nr:hypothetical protein [Nitrososphaeraceae archaeon]